MNYRLKDSWKVTVVTEVASTSFTFDFLVSNLYTFDKIESIAKGIIKCRFNLRLSAVHFKSISLASTTNGE